MFEESLGASARATLDPVLKGGGWLPMRLALGRGNSAWGAAAVGYRFETPGPWSEPAETLAPPEVGPFHRSRDPLNPEINTVFVNRYGVECGRFLTDPPPAQFLIDNADLPDLLRVVASCAMNTTRVNSAAPKEGSRGH
jgi:hypothetical protein